MTKCRRRLVIAPFAAFGVRSRPHPGGNAWELTEEVPEAVETLHCPTCLCRLVDGRETRCPACRAPISRDARPLTLLERELQARIEAKTAAHFRERRRAAKAARRIASLSPTAFQPDATREPEPQPAPASAAPKSSVIVDIPAAAVHAVRSTAATAPTPAPTPPPTRTGVTMSGVGPLADAGSPNAAPVAAPAPAPPPVREWAPLSPPISVPVTPPVAPPEVEPPVAPAAPKGRSRIKLVERLAERVAERVTERTTEPAAAPKPPAAAPKPPAAAPKPAAARVVETPPAQPAKRVAERVAEPPVKPKPAPITRIGVQGTNQVWRDRVFNSGQRPAERAVWPRPRPQPQARVAPVIDLPAEPVVERIGEAAG